MSLQEFYEKHHNKPSWIGFLTGFLASFILGYLINQLPPIDSPDFQYVQFIRRHYLVLTLVVLLSTLSFYLNHLTSNNIKKLQDKISKLEKSNDAPAKALDIAIDHMKSKDFKAAKETIKLIDDIRSIGSDEEVSSNER